MDKIETPEEFREFVDEVMALGWRDQELPGEGDGEIAYAKVAARDAAIRADERRKAAGRLLADMEEWKNIAGLGAMSTDMLAMWITKRIKAAIMAEPEEGV
jgi:hypothetical protein